MRPLGGRRDAALPVAAGEDGYPRFSPAEMDLRRAETLAAMNQAGVEHLVVYAGNRFGPAVQWLSGWPTTSESVLLLGRERPDTLLVQLRNHVPNAREIATGSEVRWAGDSTVETVLAELESRRARGRIGVMGPVPYGLHARLGAAFADVIDLNASYVQLRQVKSEEELQWVRAGAELTDRAIDALLDEVRSGMDEHALADLVERAYVPAGGGTHIHFFATTSMDAPRRCVPAQWPSGRWLRPGDVLVTEISASYWGYPGQVLRTFAVAADPPALYVQLHQVAEAALDAILKVLRAGTHPREVIEAASVIEDAGFTVYDDLLHGFVGGYLPPVLGSRSGRDTPVPDLLFERGMTVVVQPNVVTRDEQAGVQVGELVLVTDGEPERLQRSERGFARIG